jgi:Flp pilus assembly pilin Flp
MNPIVNKTAFTRSRRNRRGQGMVEWGLMVSLVALLAAAVLSMMGQRVSSIMDAVARSTSVARQASDVGELTVPDGSGGGVGASGQTAE